MKPLIKISDYNVLKDIIRSGKSNGFQIDLNQLEAELKNCQIVEDKDVPQKVVSIGSTVQVEDLVSKHIINATIVHPSKSNIKEGKISILAPLSVALLGFKEGHTLKWKMPSGEKELKIVSVLNS
ncbi:hypothetical protein GCM10028791_08970 [Echinicola sediminis]